MKKRIVFVALATLFSIAACTQNSWGLKSPNQPGLTKAIAQSQIQPFYDERDTDDNLKGIEEKPEKRNINNPHFFQTPAGVYAIVVVQNIVRKDLGVSGWCDIWLFERKNSKWLIAGRKIKVIGGGYNGQSGEFKELFEPARTV